MRTHRSWLALDSVGVAGLRAHLVIPTASENAWTSKMSLLLRLTQLHHGAYVVQEKRAAKSTRSTHVSMSMMKCRTVSSTTSKGLTRRIGCKPAPAASHREYTGSHYRSGLSSVELDLRPCPSWRWEVNNRFQFGSKMSEWEGGRMHIKARSRDQASGVLELTWASGRRGHLAEGIDADDNSSRERARAPHGEREWPIISTRQGGGAGESEREGNSTNA